MLGSSAGSVLFLLGKGLAIVGQGGPAAVSAAAGPPDGRSAMYTNEPLDPGPAMSNCREAG